MQQTEVYVITKSQLFCQIMLGYMYNRPKKFLFGGCKTVVSRKVKFRLDSE